MEYTEEERKGAWLAGCSVEEWRRRGTVAMRAQEETAGGFVVCREQGGRMVRMDAADGDGDDSSSTELAAQAHQHLKKFLDAPNAADSQNHLARSSAMLSAALAKRASENAERASAASMRSTFRG
jgi:hypothetical protein